MAAFGGLASAAHLALSSRRHGAKLRLARPQLRQAAGLSRQPPGGSPWAFGGFLGGLHWFVGGFWQFFLFCLVLRFCGVLQFVW